MNITDILDEMFNKKQKGSKTRYKTKKIEVIKIPFDEKELGYLEKSLGTYLSSYRGNIKKGRKKGKPAKLVGNYLDILYMILLYEKLTNTKYYEKELFDLMELKKDTDIRQLIEERRKNIYE